MIYIIMDYKLSDNYYRTIVIQNNYETNIQEYKDYIPNNVRIFMLETKISYTSLINGNNLIFGGPNISQDLYNKIMLCLDILLYFNELKNSDIGPISKDTLNKRLQNYNLDPIE